VLSLGDMQVDILGAEDESVVVARSDTVNKIKRLEEAMEIAGKTWRKSMQLEK
jgi:kynureninase